MFSRLAPRWRQPQATPCPRQRSAVASGVSLRVPHSTSNCVAVTAAPLKRFASVFSVAVRPSIWAGRPLALLRRRHSSDTLVTSAGRQQDGAASPDRREIVRVADAAATWPGHPPGATHCGLQGTSGSRPGFRTAVSSTAHSGMTAGDRRDSSRHRAGLTLLPICVVNSTPPT